MKHNTQGISLEQFISEKPQEIRLGQWFVNCYWKGSDESSQALYQLDGSTAKKTIIRLMRRWHWTTLPEYRKEV